MPSLAVAGWVLLRLSRQPSSWLWLSLALLLWAAATVLSPIGMTTASGGMAPLLYEVAFLAVLAGSALALLPLSEAQWLFARLDGPVRLRTRAAGLAAGGTAGLVAAGAVGLLIVLLMPTTGPRMSLYGASSLGRGCGLMLLHVVLLGLLLLRSPLSATSRALALPLLAWVLPALLPDAGFLSAALRSLLDVSAHFGAEALPADGSALAPWTALLALCGAVILVETEPVRRAPHEPR